MVVTDKRRSLNPVATKRQPKAAKPKATPTPLTPTTDQPATPKPKPAKPRKLRKYEADPTLFDNSLWEAEQHEK